MPASDSRDESFEVDTNSPFYFNTSHWRAVDGMLEGVRERAGLMVLTGPTGSGKTMIMRAISEGLEENTPGLFLQYASLNFREFVNFLHSSLRVDDEIMDAPNKAVALREFLYVQAKRDETGVVFIDEAHNLEPDVLKMLPKLARFDTLEDGRIVGLQFVLIGSEDLRDTFADPEFKEVKDKVMIDQTLRFFTREELKQFLKKRLAPIARMTDEPITEDGIEEMGRFTGGSPRLIGMICSHTMLFAAENPGKSIDAAMVQEAAEALMLSPVENPFADEENDPVASSGPFSEADLSGETPPEPKVEPAPVAALAALSSVETVYADDADGDDAPNDLASLTEEADEADAPKADDSLYAPDHALMKDETTAEAVAVELPEEAPSDDLDDGIEDDGFDPAAFDRAMDETDEGDDLDDDFEDDFGDLEDDVAIMESGEGKPAVRKGHTSFLARLGLGKKDKDAPAKVLGASRKREKSGDEPAPVIPERGPKAVVKGEREKKMKMAGIAAAALVAVVGLGYAAKGPVMSLISGSPAPQPVRTVAAPQPVPAAPQQQVAQAPVAAPVAAPVIEQATPAAPAIPEPVTITVENERSPVTGGWGARVTVEAPRLKPQRPAATSEVPTVQAQAQEDGPTLPAAAGGIARGALDMVDRALGQGERNATGKVGGVLAAASENVRDLRAKITGDGLNAQQKLDKANALIAQGDAHIAARRYITPADGNAYDAYREALELVPQSEKAKAGVETLREHFAKKAESARKSQQWERANGHFETAIAISNLRPVN